MESFKELVITWQGFWYRKYEEYLHVSPKRISPKSYRAGLEVGVASGFWFGFLSCLALAIILFVTIAEGG